jgi:hypothetical protein
MWAFIIHGFLLHPQNIPKTWTLTRGHLPFSTHLDALRPGIFWEFGVNVLYHFHTLRRWCFLFEVCKGMFDIKVWYNQPSKYLIFPPACVETLLNNLWRPSESWRQSLGWFRAPSWGILIQFLFRRLRSSHGLYMLSGCSLYYCECWTPFGMDKSFVMLTHVPGTPEYTD